MRARENLTLARILAETDNLMGARVTVKKAA
jgi:hypothetical protein